MFDLAPYFNPEMFKKARGLCLWMEKRSNKASNTGPPPPPSICTVDMSVRFGGNNSEYNCFIYSINVM